MNEEHLGGCVIGGDIGTWAPQVWDKLISLYTVKSCVDVGCGAGHSLKYFIDKNIEGLGIEGYKPAIENSKIREFITEHDYTKGPYIPSKIYDLAWCCEFVEHVEEQYSTNFMETFKRCKIVAITHGVPGQAGFHHVNCQLPEYWIDKFQKFGFFYEKDITLQLRDLLATHRICNGVYVNETGEYGKFDNDIDPYTPHGGHIKNTLMVFKNND